MARITPQQTFGNISQSNKSNDIYTVLRLELELALSDLGLALSDLLQIKLVSLDLVLAPSDLLQIKLMSLDLRLASLHRTMSSSLT